MSEKEYPMPALTEQQRADLMEYLLATQENRCQVWSVARWRDLDALRDKIALAALTAVQHCVGALDDRGNEFSLSYYTVPPVPVLKQPCSRCAGEGWHCDEMGMVKCQQCRVVYEVKS